MEILKGQKRSKLIDSSNIKSIDGEKKIISAYVSTFRWDRMDERFEKGAWNIINYQENPVVLWAHDCEEPPIAKALSIQEDEKGLFAEFKFDEESDFAMKVFSLYARGFMNAFSVGFNPERWIFEAIEGTDRKGIVWVSAELLEFSAVPIPANPGALVMREDADFIRKSFGEHFVKSIKDGKNEQFFLTDGKEKEKEKEMTGKNFDLEKVLKSLTEMAKIQKNQKLDDKKLSLVKMTIQTLQDIVFENEIDKKEVEELCQMIKTLAEVIKTARPDYENLISKFMIQYEMAMRHR